MHSPQLGLVLSGGEVAAAPGPASVQRHLVRLAASLAECCRNFPRWMDATCLPCKEQ